MNAKPAHEIRLSLARGHIELGELDVALACLERAASEAPDPAVVLKMLEELASACDVQPGSPVEGVRLLHRKIMAARPRPEPARAAPVPAPRIAPASAPPAAAPERPPVRTAPAPAPPSRSQRQIESLQGWLARVRQRYGGESAHDVP